MQSWPQARSLSSSLTAASALGSQLAYANTVGKFTGQPITSRMMLRTLTIPFGCGWDLREAGIRYTRTAESAAVKSNVGR